MATCFWMMMKALFNAIGDATILLTQWCALQAFVEATMWHNTEPQTLGISIWATSLFASACFQGIVCSFIYTVCNILKLSKSRESVLTAILTVCGRTVPALSLFLSSLPFMDDKPAGRTIILYIAMFATQLHLMLRLQARDSKRRESPAGCGISPRVVALNSKGITGCDVIAAALVTMGLRWCYYGVNIFYEYWTSSLICAVFVSIYSCVRALDHRNYSLKQTIILSVLKTLKRSRCDSYQDADSKGDTNHSLKVRPSSNSGDPAGEQKIYDSTSHFEEDVKGDYAPYNDETKIKDEDTVSADIRGPCCSKASCLNGLYCYALTAPAIGSLCYLFLWTFTSPVVLSLWGGFDDDLCGFVVFISFAAGCCLAVLLNLEGLIRVRTAYVNNNSNADSQILKCPGCFIMASVPIIALTGGALVLLASPKWICTGAGLLSVSAPVLVRVLVVMSQQLLASMNRATTGTVSECWRISCFLLIAGLVFAIHHIIGIMFINPQVVTMFHGNMTLVLLLMLIPSVMPLILSPLLFPTSSFVDCEMPSTASPLIESPGAKKSTATRASKPTWTDGFDTASKTQYSKISFLLLISLFATLLSLGKAGCFSPHTNCCVAGRDNLRGNISEYDIRVLSWNILLGHTYTGRDNLDAVSNVTAAYNPDFLALQEATGHTPYWGGKDVFGFLQSKRCRKSSARVNPKKGSLEVGILSAFPISSTEALTLPNRDVKSLPTYTMAKITTFIPDQFGVNTSVKLHLYTVHAVYKNWTCSRETQLSCEQMQFIRRDIETLPKSEPVILMGDFNINPSEPELDIWFRGELEFKSALWPKRPPARRFFNYTCDNMPRWDDEICDCDCRDASSDPPKTTLLNRKAAVDHIFYRGLVLRNASILDTVGNVSDHYPVMADFSLKS